MIGLQKTARRAALAVLAPVGALPAVAFEDRPAIGTRYRAGIGLRSPRTPAGPEPLAPEAVDESVERPVHHRCEIAIRHAVAEQISRLHELGMRVRADGQLHEKRRRRERLRARSRLRPSRGQWSLREWHLRIRGGNERHAVGHGGPRGAAGHQFKYLRLRKSRDLRRQLVHVLLREMLLQEDEPGEMQVLLRARRGRAGPARAAGARGPRGRRAGRWKIAEA